MCVRARVRVCVRVCLRETGQVAAEGCDRVVTEMYGVIALLKQRGRDLQSHRAVDLSQSHILHQSLFLRVGDDKGLRVITHICDV